MDRPPLSTPPSKARDTTASRMIIHYWWFVLATLMASALVAVLDRQPGVTALESLRALATPFLVAAMGVAPLVIWDAIRVGRRLTGPPEQVQESMHRYLAAGDVRELPEPLDDELEWGALTRDWNRILAVLSAREADAGASSPVPPPMQRRQRSERPHPRA